MFYRDTDSAQSPCARQESEHFTESLVDCSHPPPKDKNSVTSVLQMGKVRHWEIELELPSPGSGPGGFEPRVFHVGASTLSAPTTFQAVFLGEGHTSSSQKPSGVLWL